MQLPYEALVFDLGGVIVPHDNEALYRRLGARCAATDAAERIRSAVREPGWETGARTIPQLHHRLEAELGYAGGWDAFVVDWCSHLKVDGAMLDFVTRLAADNRILIFSNTNHEHWQHLLALTEGALGKFEAYLSHEIGAAKPAPDAFRLVARRAGIAPERSLFVDDRAANVAAARAVGFIAEVFTDQAALERFLER
jgi:HAD superfamily hydrolase (TIGR01509 family)